MAWFPLFIIYFSPNTNPISGRFNVGAPQPDLPIAFCDACTVPVTDLESIHVPSYAGGDFAFDTLAVAPPQQADSHAWYTFPELSASEVVAFRKDFQTLHYIR